MEAWVDKQQQSMDVLISSIPCTDASTPEVHDLTVCRECTDWTPSIVYCLNINGTMYMDAYWTVPASFDQARF